MSESSVSEVKPTEKKTGAAALDDIFQPFNRSDAPGLVVGVAQHGKTLYRRAFGLASVELGVANTPWTRMRIGSTSKQFTCLAALLLAEEGKLDLDVSARIYLPELPALKGEPTLRQFMSHTGGYRCYLDAGFMAEGVAIKPKGVALAVQVRQREVNFAPGEKMIYNNGGYHMLSLVIERVSGMPFESFLKERIFTPLSMVDTDSVPSDFIITRGIAALHVPLPDGSLRRGIFPTEEVLGEGAMVSTIDDMLLWLAHLRGPKKVGSEKSWEQMTTCTRLNNGTVNPYALGLVSHSYRSVDVIHHNGGVIGGTCQMITVPAHGLDIIIIANGITSSPAALANKVIDTLLGDEMLAAPETRADAARFKPMMGTRYHASDSGLTVSFADAAGKFGLLLYNFGPAPLRDEGESLRLGFEDAAVGPFVIDTKELATEGVAPASLRVREAGHVHRLERLPEAAPLLSEVGQALVGRYRAHDLDADARIAFDGEVLELKIFGKWGANTWALEAFSPDVFGGKTFVSSLPFGASITVERKEGRVTALRVDSLRTRRMLFERVGD